MIERDEWVKLKAQEKEEIKKRIAILEKKLYSMKKYLKGLEDDLCD